MVSSMDRRSLSGLRFGRLISCKQLDRELQQFVRKEGFLTAEDCYKKISQLVDEDRERHKAAVAAVLAQLQASADFRRIVAGADAADAAARGDDGAKEGDGGAKGGDEADPGKAVQGNVVCFMFLPASLARAATKLPRERNPRTAGARRSPRRSSSTWPCSSGSTRPSRA